MTTRRDLLLGATVAPLALGLNPAVATEHRPKGDKRDDTPKFLFVQSAEGIRFADGRLTLTGVSPVTVLFSDRPDRLAGHMTTASFVPFWNEGDNSFASDPPNANLSLLDGDAMQNVVVELRGPTPSKRSTTTWIARVPSRRTYWPYRSSTRRACATRCASSGRTTRRM